ncbi:hypothetical protein PAMP_006095 [Pampus punctatissimus]
MERGLHFGNVSISLVLLLLLKALTGFGTSQTQGSAIGREPQSAVRGSGSTTEEDGARVMERGLENVGAPVTGADVTVEDDEYGSAAEADESYGESKRQTRFDASTSECSVGSSGTLGSTCRNEFIRSVTILVSRQDPSCSAAVWVGQRQKGGML